MEDFGHPSTIDEGYEFSPPKFYDYINVEMDEERTNTELWFETAISYAPSLPDFMGGIEFNAQIKAFNRKFVVQINVKLLRPVFSPRQLSPTMFGFDSNPVL